MLFVGNSYTANEGGVYNYLAKALSAADGPTIRTDKRIYYGKPLRAMFTDDVQAAIRSGDFDTVVITSGDLPTMNQFHKLIHRHRQQTVVFMTWAGRHPGNRATMKSYTEATKRSVAEMRTMEKDTGATIVPAAVAYHDLTIRPPHAMPRIDYLWIKGNIHQNELGTMVNAWMFYTMLTGKSPVGVDFDVPPFVVDGVMKKTPEVKITPELRRELQQRVWKIAQAWRSGKSHLD